MDLCSLTFRAFGLRISLILLLASVSIYLSLISLFFHSNISQVYCRIDISTTSSSFVASISSGATVPGYILPSIWDLNVPQHCTPYSELAYASVSTYPPRVPPEFRCRLINRLLSTRSNPSHAGQQGYYPYYPTRIMHDRSWVSVAGVFYPPQSLPVGHPRPASTVPPAAQHKHGGNNASGGQAELGETI